VRGVLFFEDVMFSLHHLSSRQGTSAPAAGCHRGGAQLTALAIPIDLGLGEMPVLFYRQLVELAAIPIGSLRSRLALAGLPSEAAWIKSQQKSATDELR
jgi:hypothetical protein